jgi:uncharacterized membrane protein YdjX (TVP38/TMEM64 family)
MDDPLPLEPPEARTRRRRVRLILFILLAVCVVVASAWLFGTPRGRSHLEREHLRHLGVAARGWANDNPVRTVGMFLLVYTICAVLLLPVWWLQMLAGFAFGLWVGLGLSVTASTVGAVVTAYVSRWLGEEWVRERIIGTGKKASKLERLVEAVDRNGLLVVLISRLCYAVPYGVSNYLFGLVGIRMRDIILGTALGGVPVYAGWVAAGAKPDWLRRWEFWVIVVAVNLLLLVPLIVHSRRGDGSGSEAKGIELDTIRS